MKDGIYDVGLYSMPEIARLLGMRPGRIRIWLDGDFKQRPVVDVRNLPKGEASFTELVELRLIQELLNHYPLPRVRKFHENLGRELSTPYPFATRRLYMNGRTLIAEFKHAGKVHLIDAGAIGQMVSGEIILKVATEVRREESRAVEWRPSAGVVLDPRHLFGTPRVEGRNVPTSAVHGMYIAEGSRVEPVCNWYGISREQVLSAVRFEESLGKKPKAA